MNILTLNEILPNEQSKAELDYAMLAKGELIKQLEYENNVERLCWAAAKPGRSERGQNKAATLAARPAAKNLDSGVSRPNH
ncbi:hypothetical protein BpHYR1_010319 [Brachionus plicatilis]|uniref:Uncharacterized protein n=1 Tax=Brachionus plicatilis TaxID=10195 RepID=A0A3M7Q0W1_BRAPC|nr:hypothetical protein BpHYR1_010319 [Brachionus plicatilis]